MHELYIGKSFCLYQLRKLGRRQLLGKLPRRFMRFHIGYTLDARYGPARDFIYTTFGPFLEYKSIPGYWSEPDSPSAADLILFDPVVEPNPSFGGPGPHISIGFFYPLKHCTRPNMGFGPRNLGVKLPNFQAELVNRQSASQAKNGGLGVVGVGVGVYKQTSIECGSYGSVLEMASLKGKKCSLVLPRIQVLALFLIHKQLWKVTSKW